MDLTKRIKRVPRPYDADRGSEVANHLGEISPELRELIAGVAGCSPFLGGLIEKESTWLLKAVTNVGGAIDAEIQSVAELAPDVLASGMRRSKRRISLLVAVADLAGAWHLDEVTQALTDFADAACDSAICSAVLHQIKRGKLPGMTKDDAADAAGMVVLAMGKMGAYELNYSSDIDLICLFDETRFEASSYHDARSALVRATRAMTATLSEITAQGYVFRTDLRLRPDPSVTPVCIAMEAAEQYYESLGRTWERAAFIKARAAAGDKQAGTRFLEVLRPFVWRRHLDFAAIQDAHDMRLAIREHKGLGGQITLPGHNVKLGRGGIREIEFFTQTRQLIAGGRDPDLRCRGTVPGLQVLATKGWVDQDVSATLEDHYIALRTVEHRLQMVQDAQTHNLPKSEEGFARLASMMDQDVLDLKRDLSRRLAQVHEMTEGFFAPAKLENTNAGAALDDAILDRWVSYPALRSARSRQVFERVRPELLSRLAQAARPQEALLAFDGFLLGLPAGVQLFSLLEANPQLADLIIDITGTSPALGQYLSRNAEVFDAVIGGDFFADWPGQLGLQTNLQPLLAAESGYEQQLDAARRWYKEWHFRVGVHLLRGLVAAEEARQQYSDLARAVLAEVWPKVVEQFALKHGTPPGRGAIVLGMGSLGAEALNAGSDLDLIMIYDPLSEDSSVGKKPLPARLYYARLTQAFITALSAPMSQGKLFEVDMRLRPSGNQGPVATSWAAFQSYQRDQAWVWEHLALTRAAVVAGHDGLARDARDFQKKLLTQPRDLGDVAREVVTMQMRIRDAKPAGSIWEVKNGPGRLQEVELIAQAGALLSGRPTGVTRDGLSSAAEAGLVTQKDAETLADAAAMYADLHTAVRLLSDKPIEGQPKGLAAQSFLLRTMGLETMKQLGDKLVANYSRCNEILTLALAPYQSGDTKI